MKSFQSYRLYMTPLSPIHIGTGESYEPTNYVIEDETLYEFDTGGAISVMTEADRNALLTITNSHPGHEMLGAVQRFFFERRNKLMAYAVQHVPVLPGVARLYQSRIGQVANHEADGKKAINQLEIDRTGFNSVTRQPVLFGSSLKGSIRTALLDKVNGGRSASEPKEGLHEFQGRVFKYRDERRRLILEQDPMRLVQISDAAWNGESDLPSSQVYLAVNRKKAPVVDEHGVLRKSVADGKNLTQTLECISSWRYRAFSGQLNVQRVNGMSARHGSKVPASDFHFAVAEIAQACNAFYRPILENENETMRGRAYVDSAWDMAVSALLRKYDAKMQRGEAFLLRVGRHSGAESVTLNGVRDIRIMLGKDPMTNKQRFANEGKSRTLWLAAQNKDQQQGLFPFGWLLVEVHSSEALPDESPELREACEPFLKDARTIAARLVKRRVELDRVRFDIEEQRRNESERKLIAAEEEARCAAVEAQRKTALAAMSVEEREIEEFRTIYEQQRTKGGYNPSGIFAEKRISFFKQALEWTNAEVRSRAAALLRDTIKWTDWPGNKERKAEFKAWLENLEKRL